MEESKTETNKEGTNKEAAAKANILHIVLDKWVPAAITAGIGGLLVALLVPGIQSNYAEQAALKNRKVALWESIGLNFTNFMNSNFQLVSIATDIRRQEQSNKTPSDATIATKEEYRQSRDAHASKLNSDLVVAAFYFDKSTATLVNEYRNWILSISMATVDTMPSRSEFESWRDKFLANIGSQIDTHQ